MTTWWRWAAVGSLLTGLAALTVGVASAATIPAVQFAKVQTTPPIIIG